MEVNVRAKLADGIQDVRGLHAAGDDLGQQRLKDKEVLVADEVDFDGGISPGKATELPRDAHAGESAAEDDDSRRTIRPAGQDQDSGR